MGNSSSRRSTGSFSTKQKYYNSWLSPLPQQNGTPTRASALPQHKGTPTSASALPQHKSTPTRASALPQHKGTPTKASALPQHRTAPTSASTLPQHSGTPARASILPQHKSTLTSASASPQHKVTPTSASSLPQHTVTPTSASALLQHRRTKPGRPTTSNSASAQHSRATTSTKASSSNICLSQRQASTHRPASQNERNSADNYVIPALSASPTREYLSIASRQRNFTAEFLVCPQYNGRECLTEDCRRLHVCFYWATKTCNRNACHYDHYLLSPHNQRLFVASLGKQNVSHTEVSRIIKKKPESSSKQTGPQICMYNVLKRCKKEPCPRVHCTKNYLWEVRDHKEWIQLSYSQSDYLEVMYSYPSEKYVDLIPPKIPLHNRSLRRLTSLLSKEASWTVNLETMKLEGGSSVLDIRRLSTPSDLTSCVHVATRWLWYWQGDDSFWEPYGEGVIEGLYYVALSDALEYLLQILNKKLVTISIGGFRYVLDIEKMTQKNLTTGRTRNVRRRPACNVVNQQSVRFDELFLPLPASRRFLKLPVPPMSSEFSFVKNLLKQTLNGVKVASMQRIQNDHLWMAYQTKKKLLISLYRGDVNATNEQYLFHGTGIDAVDLICENNLDWKLSGTNVGHMYGHGTYFSNLASVAHPYAQSDTTGKRVMFVVLVLVGKMTRGHYDMTLPPINTAYGRTYDTTCDSDTDANIFVKYNRDEYYPAYVVRYYGVDIDGSRD